MSGLEANPFDWQVTADQRVFVSRGGRQIVVVAGRRGVALAQALADADPQRAQQLLARATGNYRRGHEHGPVRPKRAN